jgi:hypothetical protein
MTPRARRKWQTWQRATIAALFLANLTCGPARLANAAETDPAAALISRARAALGPGLGHVKSLHLSGTFNTGDISGTTKSWIDVAGGRFATNISAGPLTKAHGYDGRTAWRSDAKGVVLLQTGPLARAINANEIFDNTYALFKPEYGGAKVLYLGQRTDAGKNYEVIVVTPKGGFAEQIGVRVATEQNY